MVDRLLEQAGVVVGTAMELGSTEALVEAVRAGIGIAWVPRLAAQRQAELGQMTIFNVAGLDLRRSCSSSGPRMYDSGRRLRRSWN